MGFSASQYDAYCNRLDGCFKSCIMRELSVHSTECSKTARDIERGVNVDGNGTHHQRVPSQTVTVELPTQPTVLAQPSIPRLSSIAEEPTTPTSDFEDMEVPP